MKGVVIVARVSRGERQQDPTNQLIPLRAVAARFNVPVVAEIVEKDSAWDQESFGRLRRQVQAAFSTGKADTLMLWAWDRYFRGTIEQGFRELRYLEEHLGVQIYSLQEACLSTATADKDHRAIIFSMIQWLANRESERKSERMRARATAKRNLAANVNSRAKWGTGYLATPAQVEAIINRGLGGEGIRAISRGTGVSKSQVARILKAGGVPTPDYRDTSQGPVSGPIKLAKDAGAGANG